ncbi:helix-turn-helix domain-containing protein [Candidatus Woesearchaeota archaeon]|nr:helix-turn-helix domain-containing protein [Candidatus Woesearchaeota archaeon]
MWIATVKIRYENSPVGIRCSRFKLESSGMPFAPFQHEGGVYYPYFETLKGLPERIAMFIEDVRTDSSVKHIEAEGDAIFFLQETSAKERVPKPIFSKVFTVKPVLTDAQGYEAWELCSWDEAALKNAVIALQKDYLNVEVLGIVQQPLHAAYSQQVLPELTDGQKQALHLAVQGGYYNYPRKTELSMLAAEAKISLSTYREHLRKSEKKLMEGIFGKPKSAEERIKGPI